MWLLLALLSAVFAALTAILAKVGIEGVNSHLATAIRTVVVLALAWGMVFSDQCPKRHCGYQPQVLDFSGAIGFCHRGFLALLFQSPAAG